MRSSFASSAPPRLFAPLQDNIPFLQRYQEIVIEASSDRRLLEQTYLKLMKLELDMVFDEVSRDIPCTHINKVTIPKGIANLQGMILWQHQNPQLFKWLFCAFQTGLVTPDPTAPGSYQTNIPLVRQVISEIHDLRVAPGAYGDVWSSLILGDRELALLKTYRNGYNADHLSHEFFIAYYLNTLRTEIPNFTYGYGMFRCESPLNDPTRSRVCPVPKLNPNGDPIPDDRNYFIMELIKPGYTLAGIVGSLSFDDFMSFYLQVIASCGVAYDRFKFTHYDLHSRNVLLQHNPNAIQIFLRYRFENRTIYLRCRAIAKIADYGTSYLEIPDKLNGVPTGHTLKFGNFVLSGAAGRHGLAPDPFHDIYKFTGTLLKNLLSNDMPDPTNLHPNTTARPNPRLFQAVHQIITAFPAFVGVRDSASFLTAFDREVNDDFSNSKIKDASLMAARAFSNQIDHILRYYPQLRQNVVFIEGQDPLPPNARFLTCDEIGCSDWNQIEELVTQL
jgi:hypothetical protein